MRYEEPRIEIKKFEVEDIVTTSGLINGGTGDGSVYSAKDTFQLN